MSETQGVGLPERGPIKWEEPEFFDLSVGTDQQRLDEAIREGRATTQRDPVLRIANDLFECEHPDLADDIKQREEYVESVIEQGNQFGTWVLFPWSSKVVRFADKESHLKLLTARNNPLVKPQEQKTLYSKTIADIGLSVGSNALSLMARSGIGGTHILVDFDTLSPMNLNRLEAPFDAVGANKVDLSAVKVSELNPYVKLILMREGISPSNLDELKGYSPDMVIEEVDNMAIMALVREFARSNKLPLITGTDLDKKSVIDVERYDLGLKKLFNGRLNEKEAQLLIKSLSGDEEDAMSDGVMDNLMLKHLGITNLSVRFMQAAMARGKEISGHPQLGTTASGTGREVVEKVRDIFLGAPTPSGRYVGHPTSRPHLPTIAQATEAYQTVKDLLQYAKSINK